MSPWLGLLDNLQVGGIHFLPVILAHGSAPSVYFLVLTKTIAII